MLKAKTLGFGAPPAPQAEPFGFGQASLGSCFRPFSGLVRDIFFPGFFQGKMSPGWDLARFGPASLREAEAKTFGFLARSWILARFWPGWV